MHTSTPPAPRRDAVCAVPSPARGATTVAPASATPAAPLFPPPDADAEARRRWLATSPWPEVVFAAAV